MTCEEGTSAPRGMELNPENPVTPGCTICPFPERCPGGGFDTPCTAVSHGPGCSECIPGWYSVGGSCTECPEGGAARYVPLVLAIVAGIIIIVVVWKLSATPDALQELIDNAEDAKDLADDADAIHGEVSNAIAFFGITTFHLQLSAINLSLPGFPFSDMLRTIAKWISNLFSFDIGTAAAPECFGNAKFFGVWMTKYSEGDGVIKFKIGALCGAVGFAMLAFWMIGKWTGRRNHARNAMLATYTLVVGALAKSGTTFFDCSDGWMDAMPSAECYNEQKALAFFAILLPGVIIPSLVLMCALRRKAKKVPCLFFFPCFDWIDKGETFSHAASYGWVTRKYKTSHQSFEVVSIAYKVAMAVTSSEYTYF
jgi:hypothetical protein